MAAMSLTHGLQRSNWYSKQDYNTHIQKDFNVTEHILKQVKTDVEFLLTFTPASNPSEVVPNLAPMMYVTGTYEGDIKLAEKVQDIRERYDIVEQNDEEEDFEETPG